jgi:hypothetical protein
VSAGQRRKIHQTDFTPLNDATWCLDFDRALAQKGLAGYWRHIDMHNSLSSQVVVTSPEARNHQRQVIDNSGAIDAAMAHYWKRKWKFTSFSRS